MEPLVYQNLEIIWDYMHLRMELGYDGQLV